MKICLKCNRGLFDRDARCDKCGCIDIMDNRKYQTLYKNFKNSSTEEQQKLRQMPEYQIICKYKFLVDKKNTPEMRKEQSERDKQHVKQESDRYHAELQRNARQRQLVQQRNKEESNIPKCPTCQSTKIKKISDLKKATGFMMVGIFSSNFGKTMECENCGYKW